VDAPDEEKLGRAGLAIFALALCVRAVHLWQLQDAPFFPLLMGDAEGYSLWAAELAGGSWLGERTFYQAPLYPYFMGVVYTFAGESPAAVKLVQALLGAGACALLAHAGMRFFSRRVGLASGVALALYAPALFFDGLIQKSALDGFWLCALLAVLGDLQRRPLGRRWLVAGTLLGALVLTRENALALLPPILLFAALRGSGDGMRRAAPALLLLVGVGLLLVPVALRNLAVGGQLHLTTSQFGTNFYIGNGEHANGRYVPLRYGRGSYEHEREDATQLAEDALGRSLSPGEVSSYWSGRAFEHIRSEPGDWALLMGRKLLLLSNAAESVDTEDLYTHAEWSWLLRGSHALLHFGVLAPLALLGVIVTWPRRRSLWLLYSMILCYAGSVAIFYVFARYRYPLVPLLIPFAAAGVVELPGHWRRQGWALRIASAAAVLAAAVFCNWPVESPSVMRSATHRNIGLLLVREGRHSEAREHYERSLVFDPDSVLTLHALGTALRRQGDLDGAAMRYREALDRKPDYAPSHSKLGIVLAMQRDYEGSLEHQRRAIELEPGLALAHFQLALSLATLGRPDEAELHFREAIRLEPRNRLRLARTVLGTLSRGPGRRERVAALRLAQLAAESRGAQEVLVQEALSAAYTANGQWAKATESAERAIELAASDPALGAAERAELATRLNGYRGVGSP
jgi:tetratricopeptide (TPR) repeat protein